MGVATSTTQFFRTVGVTVMGALLTNRLHAELAERAPAAGATDISAGALLGGADVPGATADVLRGALDAAIHPVFLIGLPPMAVAFVATLFVEQRELRTSVHGPGEAGRELFDEIGDEFAERPAHALRASRPAGEQW
jgi:hypothetical protein